MFPVVGLELELLAWQQPSLSRAAAGWRIVRIQQQSCTAAIHLINMNNILDLGNQSPTILGFAVQNLQTIEQPAVCCGCGGAANLSHPPVGANEQHPGQGSHDNLINFLRSTVR